jgi:hypothetical protein
MPPNSVVAFGLEFGPFESIGVRDLVGSKTNRQSCAYAASYLPRKYQADPH